MEGGVDLCDDGTAMTSAEPASPSSVAVGGDRPPEPRRAARSTEGNVLGGVAAGLAEHLGVPVMWVRAFFVVTAVVGFGVVLYAALWLTLPLAQPRVDVAPGLEAADRGGLRPGRRAPVADTGVLVALGALGLGAAALLDLALGGFRFFWPAVVGVVGIAVLWHQADQAQRERWMDSTERIGLGRLLLGSGGAAAYARVAVGLGLLVTALAIFAAQSGRLGQARDVLLAGVLGMAGLAVTLGPWLHRLAAEVATERAERVRTQERADVAAHLHDSVLQTLALIQTNAHDPGRVAQLARAQERDLRAWLYGSTAAPEERLAAALSAVAAEVEDSHGLPVEVVTVGDAPLTPRLDAMVAAAREALVNAARHSGADRIDLYAEVADGRAEVFVRDRGRGFDPDAIPADRLGLRGSIVDRMRRHGGEGGVRTSPGQGAEVYLRMDEVGRPGAVHPDDQGGDGS
jgi:signal transduction histidine kinase/phage shock protein PspC (stress-responsive transcriptional regulator)